jgi:RNA methyltransferase, TrmH family
MITSKQNTKVKLVQSLQSSSRTRKSENKFVIEGIRLAEEAIASNWKTDFVLYTDEISQRGKSLLSKYENRGVLSTLVSTKLMRLMSDTETPQGLLVVLVWQSMPLPEPMDFIIVADRIRDPGNLGTIIRTADAAGVQAVITTPGTVDFLSPKVIRAGMGSHFHLPVLSKDYEQLESLSKSLNFYLASVNEGFPYTDNNFQLPTAIVIGNEAEGASQEMVHLANKKIQIPMLGKSESLNAATAAGVLLFEVARQRQLSKRNSEI